MNTLKQRYLASKEFAWSYTTYKGEASRLATIPDEYLPNDPAGLFRHLSATGYKPYTVRTIFIRASELVAFGWPKQANAYKQFIRDNARLFKNAYTPRRPQLAFDAAVAKMRTELTPELAAQAFALLASGLRVSEVNSVRADGTVVGKGSKVRVVANKPSVVVNVAKLRRALKPLGLTPHMLRKLAATRAVELGAREADLLAIFGWTSAQTASYYVNETRAAEVAAKLKIEVYTHG